MTSFELPVDHPGFSDPSYRARRATIAAVGDRHEPGGPIEVVPYTDDEHALWALVTRELGALHRQYAVGEYLDAADRLALPADHVPQLADVDERLRRLSGFGVRPVAGLVPTRTFYGALAERTFCSTQYLRHPSVPFYTPEPDLIHEAVGHLAALASPLFAGLYELAGQASLRATAPSALEAFSRVFWFTVEFGVCWEAGELRTYGAGLLSSFGEIQAFRSAEIRPWDLKAMAATDYDITRFQPVLFAAPSLDDAVSSLADFFAEYDDDAYGRLVA